MVSLPFPVSPGEAARLAALRRYEILDSGTEEGFDRVVQLAASLFNAPMAVISLVDTDRLWFKSRVGVPLSETPRSVAFCAHTILGADTLVVLDASRDPRFADNPLVAGDPGIRFYAGAPLVTRDGFSLGALAVMDVEARDSFDASCQQRLATLARLIMNELELRFELSARARAERDLKFVNDLMVAIVEAPSVNTALETSLRLICQVVGAAHGRAWSMVEHTKQCQLVAAWGPTGSEWEKRLDQQRTTPLTLTNSIVGAVLTSNRRHVVSDIGKQPDRYAAARDALAIGLRCVVCVPVQQDGRHFALNIMFEEEPPEIDRLADRIEDLAKKMRPALARKIAEERIMLLQSVMQHANDAVMIAEGGGGVEGSRIVYVSPAMTRMTGYGADELHQRSPALLWEAQADVDAIASLYDTVERGEPTRIELACRRKDGSEFWADISAVPVIDKDTGARKLLAILRDTTERRRLEEALRHSEATFRLLFSNNPIPMWAYDLETQRFLEVNNSAIDQYGYSREQFLAMEVGDILITDEAAHHPPQAALAAAFGRLGLSRHRKADGEPMIVDLVSHRLEFNGHQAAIVAAIDVTEQKRAEEEIRRAKEAAEAASRAKTDLLANMSHELRTPLNAIIGFSEIMHAGLFGPLGSAKYDGYVSDIRHSAGHLLTVITDILDLAKIEANSFRLHEAIIEPSEIITSALRLVKPRADSAGVSLRYDKRHKDLLIRVDETALKRVLINLLSNAVKFSEAGTTVVVRSQFDAHGGFAIAVVDQGIGMAAEEIPIALTPFRQVNTGLQRKYEGTGLGLPIAKQLVEMHGGMLTIESARGTGTTASVVLPKTRVMAAA